MSEHQPLQMFHRSYCYESAVTQIRHEVDYTPIRARMYRGVLSNLSSKQTRIRQLHRVLIRLKQLKF